MTTVLALHVFLLSGPPPEGGGGGLASLFLPFLLVFIVFYFFIIRPQKKREDTRKTMISAVKKGDRIVTIGGVHATVTKVDETSVLAEVDENVKLRFDKAAIASVATKE
ncbi:MAG: preprotein translocase subunit YajC [Rhodothermales bacterium]